VSYALRVPVGAALRFSVSGNPDTSIVVRIEADGHEAEELARFDASPAERVVRVPDRVDIVRLSLAAEGGAPSSAIRLANPVLDLATSAPTGAVAPTQSRPNVILYLVDTLRADALGSYGSVRPTSPAADAFAKDAVRYSDAVTEAPWTRAAVATLFTGLPPQSHGVNGRADALGGHASTMAELFKRAGYETAGFVTNGNVAPVFGFARGFDRYELLPGADIPGLDGTVQRPQRPPPSSEDATQRVLEWLDARKPSRPFLLYVHTADPHGPYLPPPEYRARVGAPSGPAELGSLAMLQQLHAGTLPVDAKLVHGLRALYDGEVAENDEQLGRLLDALKHRGLYDDALIVFLADHGEEFYEHRGWEHGHSLYAELEQVPLIVKLPRGEAAGTTIDRTVQLEDVLPTLLDVLGVESPAPLPGHSLLESRDGADPRAAFAHLALDGRLGDAVVDGTWKLVTTGEGIGLFDRRSDPGDQHDVVGDHPVTVAYLESLLARHRADTAPGAVTRSPAVPPEVERNLKALGYAK
jgi:arylsulfatase A-like enzyme